ncbi:hypothetical protein [Streptomyces sp. NPDC048636]|uniref:hypothetical protein n=1 Tax=Streptomyces sp. NPDC048636 TaxID=3155762 RepID=UPI00342E33B5
MAPGARPGTAEPLRRVREPAGLPAYPAVYRDGRITMIVSREARLGAGGQPPAPTRHPA